VSRMEFSDEQIEHAACAYAGLALLGDADQGPEIFDHASEASRRELKKAASKILRAAFLEEG
jgi:hypothetical protein